tara:strand:- start:2395 stop:2772 length:378 start_codon:yes stop_codon:yes gene_type:complete
LKTKEKYKVYISLIVVGTIIFLLFHRGTIVEIIGYISYLLLIILLCILDFKFTFFIAKKASNIGDIIRKINTYVLVSFIYFVILTPISIFFNFFNKRGMKKKMKSSSNYIYINHKIESKDFLNPW